MTNTETKSSKVTIQRYSIEEEIGNIITHAAGAIFAVAATIAMIIKSTMDYDKLNIICSVLFGLSMFELYCASTFYHGSFKFKWRATAQRFDHASINILIWGSNMMFTIAALRSPLGNNLAIFISVLSLTSLVLNAINVKKFRAPSMVIYLVSGGACIVAYKFIYVSLTLWGFILLVLGQASYVLGVISYSFKKKWMHLIFHLLVLTGSVLHFCAAYFYIL